MSFLEENENLVTAAVVIAVSFLYPLLLKLLGYGTMNHLDFRAPPFQPERHFPRKQSANDPVFDQLSLLDDDIIAHILSFVAGAPFEGVDLNFVSTLTHCLPFVSKRFHRLVQRSFFWEEALVRQVSAEPELWYRGLKHLTNEEIHSIPPNIQAKQVIQSTQARLEGLGCRDVYRRVLNEHIRVTRPIFYMEQRIKLGQPYGLHFFELRYRRLIAQVMEPFPQRAREGGPIEVAPGQAPPIFIHAHTRRLDRGSSAVLVRVLRCLIDHNDGSADVILFPIAYVVMEPIWVQPQSGNMFNGTCLRAGKQLTLELSQTPSR